MPNESAPLTGLPDGTQPVPLGAPATVARYRWPAIRWILALMLIYTAYFAAAVMIPITVAMVLSLTLSPIADQLTRWRVPRGLAAASIVGLAIALFGFLLYAFVEPAAEWVNKAPVSLREIERKIQPLKEPVDQLLAVEDELNEMTDASPNEDAPSTATGRVQLVKAVFTGAPETLFGVGATAILLFFLLAQRDSLLRKVATTLPNYSEKKLAISVVRDIQQEISRYLSTITLINAALGLVTAGMLALLDFPNPALWGVMAAITNFVPYLGALFNISVLAVVSLLSFDDPANILLPPLLFAALTSLEGQVLTPMIVGNRLALDPIVVFLLILILGWMWGVAGALIAIPLLASVKIVCQAIEALNPIARLIGYSV